jgi:nucleotide-binding universal stress UspA family protein
VKAADVEINVVPAQEGETAQTILSVVGAWVPDLVAMTTHGRSGIRRWVFGSVADKLIHATTKPFLLIHAQESDEPAMMTSMDVITVPLDGSALSNSILPYVQELALSLKARLHLVHVITPPVYSEPAGMVASYPIVDLDAWLQGARSMMEATAEQVRSSGLTVNAEVRVGQTVIEIVNAAYQAGSGLIAMATHGHSGPGRWVLGSVTDAVLRRSDLPCLIVRPEGVREA